MRFFAISGKSIHRLSDQGQLNTLYKKLSGKVSQVYFKTSNGIVGNQAIVSSEDITFAIKCSGQVLSLSDVEMLNSLCHVEINNETESIHV